MADYSFYRFLGPSHSWWSWPGKQWVSLWLGLEPTIVAVEHHSLREFLRFWDREFSCFSIWNLIRNTKVSYRNRAFFPGLHLLLRSISPRINASSQAGTSEFVPPCQAELGRFRRQTPTPAINILNYANARKTKDNNSISEWLRHFKTRLRGIQHLLFPSCDDRRVSLKVWARTSVYSFVVNSSEQERADHRFITVNSSYCTYSIVIPSLHSCI